MISPKQVVIAAIIAVAAFLVIPASVDYINPGHVGVVVRTMGGGASGLEGGTGIDAKPVGVGWYFHSPIGVRVIEYPTFNQTLVLTKATGDDKSNDEINVNTGEGQPISLDVSVSYELDPFRVPALYAKFRTDIETITHTYVKNAVRASFQEVTGTEAIADVMGPKKTELIQKTQANLASHLAPLGFRISQVTLNELRAPAGVIAAINAKNVTTQNALQAQNELQRTTFQAQGDSIKAAGRAKAITAEAAAQAEANRRIAESLSPGLIEYEKAKRWDGKLPTITGGVTPFLQVTKP